MPFPELALPANDPWAALEALLQRLGGVASAAQSTHAAVEAVCQATEADVAFWYSRQTGRAAAVVGPRPIPTERCAAITAKLLAGLPADQEVSRWSNPNPGGDDVPTAAVVAHRKTQGCVVALSFAPTRRFDDADAAAARMAVKMLLAQRAHTQLMTRQLLHGLLHSLTAVIDAKDPYTAGHSERVARIAVLVAREMGMSPATEGDVFLAGLLHDLGKIGVPDAVLYKPGPLTPEEMAVIREHPVVGENIVASIKPFDRLRPAVRHHHERYDGRGYPDGLSGEAIPILARVIGLADAVDAMMSPRRYRAARSPLQIDVILTGEIGRQFEPAAVRAFLAVRGQVYPPIFQKGIGDSAEVALGDLVSNMSDASLTQLPSVPPGDLGLR